MASKSTKEAPTGFPEFAVRRETISADFHPPLPSSTFHDFVNKRKIIPMKGIRGFQLLNASLRRLGLRESAELPPGPATRSMEPEDRLPGRRAGRASHGGHGNASLGGWTESKPCYSGRDRTG